MSYCIKAGKCSKWACNVILNENVNFEQMMSPYMLKWYLRIVRPEKFQFLEKWQNRKFDYKIVISVKNP